MRKTIAVTLAFVAVSAIGCTQADIDAGIQRAKDVAAAIKKGAAVTAAAIRQGIDDACANQLTVYSSAQATRAILMQQTGPNTTKNIAALDTALADYNQVCAAGSNPNAPDLVSLLSRAISAYAAVKAAQSKAIAAGG